MIPTPPARTSLRTVSVIKSNFDDLKEKDCIKNCAEEKIWDKRYEIKGSGEDYITRSFNTLYSSPNIVRVIKSRGMRRAGHVACMEERRGVCRILMEKPERRGSLEIPRYRWENKIKMDFDKWDGGMDRIDQPQDRDRVLVSTVINFLVP